jgi:hypothetical protein
VQPFLQSQAHRKLEITQEGLLEASPSFPSWQSTLAILAFQHRHTALINNGSAKQDGGLRLSDGGL